VDSFGAGSMGGNVMTTPQHNPSADEGLVEALHIIGAYLSESVGISDAITVDMDHEGAAFFNYGHLRLVFNAALAAARSHGGM